jgi:hypothetical protein
VKNGPRADATTFLRFPLMVKFRGRPRPTVIIGIDTRKLSTPQQLLPTLKMTNIPILDQ